MSLTTVGLIGVAVAFVLLFIGFLSEGPQPASTGPLMKGKSSKRARSHRRRS